MNPGKARSVQARNFIQSKFVHCVRRLLNLRQCKSTLKHFSVINQMNKKKNLVEVDVPDLKMPTNEHYNRSSKKVNTCKTTRQAK